MIFLPSFPIQLVLINKAFLVYNITSFLSQEKFPKKELSYYHTLEAGLVNPEDVGKYLASIGIPS